MMTLKSSQGIEERSGFVTDRLEFEICLHIFSFGHEAHRVLVS